MPFDGTLLLEEWIPMMDARRESEGVWAEPDQLEFALQIEREGQQVNPRVVLTANELQTEIKANPGDVFLLADEIWSNELPNLLPAKCLLSMNHLITRVVWRETRSREEAAEGIEANLNYRVTARLFGGPVSAGSKNWVRLSQRQPEILVLFGDSGSGKSALARTFSRAGVDTVHGDDILYSAKNYDSASNKLWIMSAGRGLESLDLSQSIRDIIRGGHLDSLMDSLLESKPAVLDIWMPPESRQEFLQMLAARGYRAFFALRDNDAWVVERDGLVVERDGLVVERDGFVAERDWWFGEFHRLRQRRSVRLILALAGLVGQFWPRRHEGPGGKNA